MKQGKYEVDVEGNLLEVGTGGSEEVSPRGWPLTVAAKARILRQVAVAEVFGLVVLVAIAVAMPDLRLILLVLAGVYALATVPVYLLYSRVLGRRVRPPSAAG